MSTPKTASAPLFKDLLDDALRDAYWAQRALVASADGIATLSIQIRGRSRRTSQAVGGVFLALRHLDIIVAIARQRKLSLARPEAA